MRGINRQSWQAACLLMGTLIALLILVGSDQQSPTVAHGCSSFAAPADHSLERFGLPDTGGILKKQGYTLSYDGRLRGPRWTLEVLTRNSLRKAVRRSDDLSFRDDPAVPREFRAHASDYAGSGFDIGHNAASANHQTSAEAMQDTFLFSNASPQIPDFNRIHWARLEAQIRGLLDDPEVDAVWVLTGPLWFCDSDHLTVKYVGRSEIPVATHFFKSAVILKRDGTLEPRTWILKHVRDPGPLEASRAAIDTVERWAGFDAWPELPEELEANP